MTRFMCIVGALSTAASAAAATSGRVYYLGELLGNLRGGLAAGSEYLDDAGLIIDTDLGRLFDAPDGRLFAYVLWNNGATFSNRKSGDLQVVSNIDAGRALRLYELWYEQELGDGVSLRAGLYDLNAEFDLIATAQLFVNSSHGIGADYGQSGRNGPSIFPVTSLAARLDWRIGRQTLIRYALLDGVPGNPSDPSDTSIRLSGDDGVLQAIEINRRFDGGARLGLGGWLYSAEFDVIGTAGARRDDGNGGLYAFADLPLGGDETLAVDAFLRYGVAEDRFNPFGAYFGAGIVVTGLLRGRPDDRLGLAVASGRAGDAFRDANRTGTGVDRHETSIELTYNWKLSEHVRLQPDIQYVIHPGLDPRLEHALVFGIRFELRTTF